MASAAGPGSKVCRVNTNGEKYYSKNRTKNCNPVIKGLLQGYQRSPESNIDSWRVDDRYVNSQVLTVNENREFALSEDGGARKVDAERNGGSVKRRCRHKRDNQTGNGSATLVWCSPIILRGRRDSLRRIRCTRGSRRNGGAVGGRLMCAG